jgi:hypothetical protein
MRGAGDEGEDRLTSLPDAASIMAKKSGASARAPSIETNHGRGVMSCDAARATSSVSPLHSTALTAACPST